MEMLDGLFESSMNDKASVSMLMYQIRDTIKPQQDSVQKENKSATGAIYGSKSLLAQDRSVR